MTREEDEKARAYCCLCILGLISIVFIIMYWYITLPVTLVVLVGFIVFKMLRKKEKYQTTYKTYNNNVEEKEKRSNYVPLKPEYPPNCVNCDMPIKVVEDLVRINGQICCKYCGHIRLNIDELYEIELRKIYGTPNKRKETRTRHISAQVKREVWQRDYGKCVECGSKERLEYGHIIPFSKGGSNTARNIQLLCEDCNRKKYDKI